MHRKGIKEKDLVYLDFNTYKKINNIELNALPREIQTLRWEESEKTRQMLIKNVKNVIILINITHI